MPDSHNQSLRSEEEAQALLRVFTLQPPADFADQVFAHIHARQAASELPPVSPVPPWSSTSVLSGFGKASWRPGGRFLGYRGAMAYGLLTTATVFIWFALKCTSSSGVPSQIVRAVAPAPVPEAPMAQAVALPAPIVSPGALEPLPREASQEPPHLLQQGEGLTPFAATILPGLPGVRQEIRQTPPEQQFVKRKRSSRSQRRHSG